MLVVASESEMCAAVACPSTCSEVCTALSVESSSFLSGSWLVQSLETSDAADINGKRDSCICFCIMNDKLQIEECNDNSCMNSSHHLSCGSYNNKVSKTNRAIENTKKHTTIKKCPVSENPNLFLLRHCIRKKYFEFAFARIFMQESIGNS